MAKKHKEAPSDAQVAIKWGVRVFVLGTLLLLLVLAVLDYRAKTSAEDTAAAWKQLNQTALADTGELDPARLTSEISGSPVMREQVTPQEADRRYSDIKQTYQWRGIFRNYVIEVGILSFDDGSLKWKVVETIDGPIQK